MFKNHFKKAAAVSLAVATAVLAANPVLATETPAQNYVTVGAHRAAEPAGLILGADLVTVGQDTVNNTTVKIMDLFGTDNNSNPCEYLVNLKNGNTTADKIAALITGTFAPNMAEGTGSDDDGWSSTTVSMNPDIYLGIAQNTNGFTYSKLDANAANKEVAYNSSNLAQMVGTMYTLAEKIDAKGATRYSGTAMDVAKDYEAFVKETQLYVLSQISAKKTVAVVGDSTVVDGTTYYKTFKYTTPRGQLAYRMAEYLQDTATNIVDTTVAANCPTTTDANGNTVYLLTAEQLKSADCIISYGIQLTPGLSASDVTALTTAGVSASKIHTGGPVTAYGILMNSVDNALGVAVANSLVYPEIIDMDEAVAYYYSHFYHIKNDRIDSVTEEGFADVEELDGITDTNVSTLISNYAGDLEDGYDYYVDEQETIDEDYPSLTLSSHIFSE